jgi:hypothetical protein
MTYSTAVANTLVCDTGVSIIRRNSTPCGFKAKAGVPHKESAAEDWLPPSVLLPWRTPVRHHPPAGSNIAVRMGYSASSAVRP